MCWWLYHIPRLEIIPNEWLFVNVLCVQERMLGCIFVIHQVREKLLVYPASGMHSTFISRVSHASALPVVSLISLQCNVSAPHHAACRLQAEPPFLSPWVLFLNTVPCSGEAGLFQHTMFIPVYICLLVLFLSSFKKSASSRLTSRLPSLQ